MNVRHAFNAAVICLSLSACAPANIVVPTSSGIVDTPLPLEAELQTEEPITLEEEQFFLRNTPPPTPSPPFAVTDYREYFPIPWTTAEVTTEEIEEALACDLTVADTLYSSEAEIEDLVRTQEPSTPCAWAILAYAMVSTLDYDEPTPDIARSAFAQAIHGNMAFLLHDDLFFPYFNSIPLVDPPPVAAQAITALDLQYQWGGIGDPVEYTLHVRDANTTPQLSVIVTEGEPPPSPMPDVSSAEIQGLGAALTDFVPIPHAISLIPCYDNSPDWSMDLTFEDGRTLHLATRDSNVLRFGGPWQSSFGGKHYIQASAALPIALFELVDRLGLPIGQPAAMACGPVPVLSELATPENG